MNAAQITWAEKGSVIWIPSVDGPLEPQMVMARCAIESVGYFCERCRQPLANVGQLVLHLQEDPPPHHVTVWCPQHRWMEAPDGAQMRALIGEAA